MKRIAYYVASVMLFISLLSQSVYCIMAATTETSEETTETTENAEFSWDEENQSNAIFTWEGNDWAQYQDRLTLSGYILASGHAEVSDLVRGLESTVKSVLDSDETSSSLAEYSKSKYTELILAIIEVLAENDGLVTAEENASYAEFNEWTKTMGKYVSPSYIGEWSTEASIRQIFYRFTYSARVYQMHNFNEDGSEVSQPSPLKVDQPFLIVLEGIVMHGTSNDTYYSFITRDTYSKSSALSWYTTHKDVIDPCYQAAGMTDYEPDEAFAAKVKAIYSVTEGYGEGATYAAEAPNDKVEAVLEYLDQKNGKEYQMGEEGPDEFDCSGLVYAALKNTNAVPGISRISTSEFPNSSFYREINTSELKPGDLLWRDGHVAFYLGKTNDGKYHTFEAKGEDYGVGYFTRSPSTVTKCFRWW